MEHSPQSYQVKLLNGLVIKDLSERELREGLEKGKYLPSDFLYDDKGQWIYLKESKFFNKKRERQTGWMALFYISFILNILMLLLIFWQKGRIEQLIK